MTVQRIPYPISAQYCENWGVVEALREIAANMLDSRAHYMCFHRDSRGVFTDFGQGFEPHCLMFGEGELKNGEQIGQFKEGLKLALLVLARKKKRVYLETTGFTILRAEMEMLELGRPGLVLYVETGEHRPKRTGTKVEVDCSKADFEQAAKMFLNLRVDGDERPTIDSTIFDPLGKQGAIYVNGLLTEAGDFGWSYNFHGEDIKGSMNRDRTVLNSWEVQRKIVDAWSEVCEASQIVKFLRRTKDKKGCRENRLFSSGYFQLDKELWISALVEFLGLDADVGSKLAFQDPVDKLNREAKEMGYTVISNRSLSMAAQAIYDKMINTAGLVVISNVTKARRRKRKKGRTNFGPYDVVPWSEISDELIYKLNFAGSIAIGAMQRTSNKSVMIDDGRRRSYRNFDQLEFFVYDKDALKEESRGAWYNNLVGISLKYLSECDTMDLVGTILHEFAHAVSKADDCTREFERMLSDFCGCLAVGKDEEKPMMIYDLTKVGQSQKRVTYAGIPCDPRPIAFETILQACGSMQADGKVVVDQGSENNQKKARTFEWQYLGSFYDAARSRARTKRSSSMNCIFRALTKTNRQVELNIEFIWTSAKATDLKVHFTYMYNTRGLARYCNYRSFYKQIDLRRWDDVPLEEAWPELVAAAGWSAIAAADLGGADG